MPTRVLLRGLPELLCNEVSLQAMLEQAQLADALVSITLPKAVELGDVFVTLVNRHVAERCINHFALCRWVGCCVSACIVEPSCEGSSGVAATPLDGASQ